MNAYATALLDTPPSAEGLYRAEFQLVRHMSNELRMGGGRLFAVAEPDLVVRLHELTPHSPSHGPRHRGLFSGGAGAFGAGKTPHKYFFL
jgi:hypothetical protein